MWGFPQGMAKLSSNTEKENSSSSSPSKAYYYKHQNLQHNLSSFFRYSPKLSFYLLATCVGLFILLQIQSLPNHGPSSTSSFHLFIHPWKSSVINQTLTINNCTEELRDIAEKLHDSVTFLPLKDLRYSATAQEGHTWFMSSMYDMHEEGEVQYQQFPSKASKGRLLCIRGHDKHDGVWNSYALAWPHALPHNATLMKGLTFVSYNHYNYDNIWHGLSSMVPFVAWHIKNGCGNNAKPLRWVLYHWGEIRTRMGPWLKSLMDATFSEPLNIEGLEGVAAGNEGDGPVCFEEAVVMRHNEGGMSRQSRIDVYDLMRCKARVYCNVSLQSRIDEVSDQGLPVIRITMFMRTGPRSFLNESKVIQIFERECSKVDGCRLVVSHSNNLTFCEQVKLMSSTDILVSPHGAQLTNMFLMDRNSSVMEFFPKGWLKLAGVGQYVYHWIASWSGMKHQGAWRDPNGDHCPHPENDRRCMSIYKNGKIGSNGTFFSEWARNVLNEVKAKKEDEVSRKSITIAPNGCTCR